MSADDDLVRVVRLACETEDRSYHEQLSLLRTACALDNRRNAKTVTNRREPGDAPSDLLLDVLSTVDPQSDGGTVKLSPAQMARWRARYERW